MSEGALYLDSSAIVKLVTPERETRALQQRVRSAAVVLTSEVSRVEVARAVRRLTVDADVHARVETILAAVPMIRLRGEILASAAALGPAALRSLDAIHLASALSAKEHLEAFIAYDERLLAAAREHGLPVESPGSAKAG